MSAFIVEDKTINRIVSFLEHEPNCCGWAFQRLGYDIKKNPEDCERLAIDLHLLNCDAVDQRYGKGTAAHDQEIAFLYRFELSNIMQVYKHARCLRYQCSEGNVTKRPLYDALSDCCASLANAIVSKIPEYNTCAWA